MNIWTKISLLGFDGTESYRSRKIKILLNRLAVLVFGMHIMYFAIVFGLGYEGFYVPSIIVLVAFSLLIYRLKLGKHREVTVIMIYMEIIYLTLISAIGYKFYFHFYFFPLYLISLILNGNKIYNVLTSLFIVGAFFLVEYLQFLYYDPSLMSESQVNFFFIFNNTFVILISVYVMFHYKLTNIAYEKNITSQKNEIEVQHQALNAAHYEIRSSIKYAKRIQNAMLPPQKMVRSYLANSFILYEPKEIIAGDFYWTEVINDRILFAVADCTGHGVPGAMISVVCHNALNRSIREFGLIDPGEILDKTREIVIESFTASKDNKLDGMDIALVSMPAGYAGNDELKIEYAGANRPLISMRKGHLKEFKSSRQSIMKADELLPFKTQEITVKKGDMIYLFSDGYYSQFGGLRDKKYKSIAFKRLLASVSLLEVDAQHERLLRVFNEWKGNNEQVDDLCIIGVRI